MPFRKASPAPADPDAQTMAAWWAAVDGAPPYLLDVTRLVSRSWTRRLPTGIDRVCYAYLHQFGPRALAVIQHRGIVRTLSPANSRDLFALLGGSTAGFRSRVAALVTRAMCENYPALEGGVYLNVSHTDFDLDAHAGWVRRHQLKPVYLLHDLIPLRNAEHCRPHAIRRHRGRVFGALRHGAGIVVGSDAVASDLEDFVAEHRLSRPEVLVAPLAGAMLQPPRAPRVESARYFLCVGTIDQRKNHLLLLSVWQKLIARYGAATPRLVVVGQWGTAAKAVREALRQDPTLRRHVSFLGRCDDDTLSDLMAGATALLMPTLAEGFGLPMAEALSLAVPVIASDLPCFREVGQGIPNLLPSGDAAAWAGLIAEFDHDGGERRRQVAQMPHYRASSWGEHFGRVEAWLPTLEASATRAALADAVG